MADTATEPANSQPPGHPLASSALDAVGCFATGCAAGGWNYSTSGHLQGLLETVDTAPTGYYEVAADGGLFAYTVPFHGSMGGIPLNKPVVGMAVDPLTGGYWEVASDGGIFAFTAPFYGSTGAVTLNAPIVGMLADPHRRLLAGGLRRRHLRLPAPFLGSMGGTPSTPPSSAWPTTRPPAATGWWPPTAASSRSQRRS